MHSLLEFPLHQIKLLNLDTKQLYKVSQKKCPSSQLLQQSYWDIFFGTPCMYIVIESKIEFEGINRL